MVFDFRYVFPVTQLAMNRGKTGWVSGDLESLGHETCKAKGVTKVQLVTYFLGRSGPRDEFRFK